MRLLFIADVPAADPVSGSEQVLYQQTVGLAEKGSDVRVITRQESGPDSVIRDIDSSTVIEGSYRANPANIRQFFTALGKYPRELYDRFRQEGDFQAVICHQPFNCLALLLAGRIKGLPLIYIFHSPSHEEYLLMQAKIGLITKAQAMIRRLIEAFCIKKAARILTLSRFMADKVRDFHHISADRIIVNPGGVDIERFKPLADRMAAKAALNLPAGKIHLLTVRNLEPRMGVDNLVRCIGLLKNDGIAVHLTLGGDGVDRQAIEMLITELGLNEDITMTGFIAAETLAQYYGAADYFILPTRHLEGFGLITPESLATGTPVLGTPVGGTKEILSRFSSKFLFKDTTPTAMADGIKDVLKQPPGTAEYEALRQECRQYAVKNYGWPRHIDQLFDIINEVIT